MPEKKEKKQNKEEEYPPAICPDCGSTNVIPVDSSDTVLKCKHCGYEGDRNLFWTRSEE